MRGKVVRHCEHCGEPFEIYHSIAAKPGWGRFCKRSCREAFESPAARFSQRIDRAGPVLRIELGPCWIWTGERDHKGYGRLWVGAKVELAHRFAFFVHHGRWPEPCALHKCDGGSIGCVRWDHLFEGTKADNSDDKVAKGRQSKGEEVRHLVKLTAEQVIEIRRRLREGASRAAVAELFGVSKSNIEFIDRGLTWKHLL